MTQEKRHPSLPSDRVTIVSLAKYSDLFDGLSRNLKQYVTYPKIDKIVVRDGELIDKADGWAVIDGPQDFNFSGNVNLGLKAADRDSDIFFISDDVRLVSTGTIETLRNLAYSNPEIGILAPRVVGAADNKLQTDPPIDKDIIYSDRYIVFVCLFIKRSVIDSVGYMDKETFNGYGWDDVDYSRRVKNSGFKLAVTPRAEVVHGVNRNGTETFIRTEKGYWDRLKEQNKNNEQAFSNKWGDNNKE